MMPLHAHGGRGEFLDSNEGDINKSIAAAILSCQKMREKKRQNRVSSKSTPCVMLLVVII